ncbi:putative 23S rRNA (uridine2479-2'-O)-methyltransferase [Pillotina sp. SPG140]|jgi:TrmH family RNA methyltransferase
MNKILINTENSEYQILQSLKLSRSKRNQLHTVFIEGIECIKQAIRAEWEITRIITRNTKDLSDWAGNIINTQKQAKIIEMNEHLYNSLCDKHVPSELLVTVTMKHNQLSEIYISPNPFIVILDRPSDHGNAGSIIRSAHSFNVDSIGIIGHGVDIYESKVIRASLGTLFHTNIRQIKSIEELVKIIKKEKDKNGMTVIGTDSEGSISIQERILKRPIMLIIGNEAKGMSIQLKKLCDEIIKIPLSGEINSLNAACAASIVFWEIYKEKTI